MLLQHLLEIAPCVGGGMFRYLFWRARDDDLPAFVAPFWTQINDPVGTTDHIEIVFDADDRIALIGHPLQAARVRVLLEDLLTSLQNCVPLA